MGAAKIKEPAGPEQPREKLLANGHASLSDSELLAVLLRTGTPRTTAHQIGQQLLQRFGSLGGLSRCSVGELARMRGLGHAKAVQLAAAFGLASLAQKELSARIAAGEIGAGLWAGGVAVLTGLLNAACMTY